MKHDGPFFIATTDPIEATARVMRYKRLYERLSEIMMGNFTAEELAIVLRILNPELRFALRMIEVERIERKVHHIRLTAKYKKHRS